MSLKHSLATTTLFGALVAMAACQASFQASTGSNTTPTAANGVAGAPATATATTPTTVAAAGSPAQTATTATTTTPAATNVTLAGGKIVVQGSLKFDSGKAILLETTENATLISDLKTFLEQNTKITQMRIEGHTDNVGDATANLDLSGQRALVVKKALVDKGVAPNRLLAVGFGDKKPIGDNATETGRAQNQRIEFRVATWNGKNYLNQDPLGGGKLFE